MGAELSQTRVVIVPALAVAIRSLNSGESSSKPSGSPCRFQGSNCQFFFERGPNVSAGTWPLPRRMSNEWGPLSFSTTPLNHTGPLAKFRIYTASPICKVRLPYICHDRLFDIVWSPLSLPAGEGWDGTGLSESGAISLATTGPGKHLWSNAM